jgi:hypothetical protein
VKLSLQRLKHVRIDNLLEGFIVGHIFVWPVSFPNFGANAGYGWKKAYGFLELDTEIEKATKAVIKTAPNAMLVQFSSSYVGEISVVCEEMKVTLI